jgi:N-acetylneuraminate synthase
MKIKKSQSKIFIIAEIGINHNGSLKNAKKLMDLAKYCDCDAVKFQKREVNITTPENLKNELKETPWGKITYLEYKKKIEFGKKDFDQIDKYSKKINIIWSASAWDIQSQKFLKRYNLPFNKVASPMLTNYPLLEMIAKERKKTFISTGMSTMKDISKAVIIFKKNKCDFELMHCVSSYPAKEEDLNLKMIPVLLKKFKCKVGYSGHESTLSPTLGACYLGATSVERHITMDRTTWGSDQAASLSKNGLKDLVSMIRKVHKVMGDGKKKILDSEKVKIKSLRYW